MLINAALNAITNDVREESKADNNPDRDDES
jgi:hypothetical protein